MELLKQHLTGEGKRQRLWGARGGAGDRGEGRQEGCRGKWAGQRATGPLVFLM